MDELNMARLNPGELQEIEEQLDVLTHAEEIKTSLYQANSIISGADDNIMAMLAATAHVLNNVAKYKPELKSLADRINSNYIDIKDISGEINFQEEQIFVDPARIETLSQRLDQLYRLMKKHQASTIEELLTIRLEIEQRVTDDAGIEELIQILRNDIITLEADLTLKATSLSKKRQMVVAEFEAEVTGILTKLGILQARFNIEFMKCSTITRDGIDKVKFLFSANKGIELRELSNAASGGELSRLMLAIKSMISQKNLLPTIIFDEIDNGVSGEVAGKVGAILKRMGGYMQVVAISHLPQIAAKGDRHYWVYKIENQHTTTTYIKQLSPNERIKEIAKMLSGETVTASAIQAAGELLKN
jgi:DNA repair protein RecN (Recombination protein N)